MCRRAIAKQIAGIFKLSKKKGGQKEEKTPHAILAFDTVHFQFLLTLKTIGPACLVMALIDSFK